MAIVDSRCIADQLFLKHKSPPYVAPAALQLQLHGGGAREQIYL